jgi:tRNA(Arg) A34 adenosine deaminase TadA
MQAALAQARLAVQAGEVPVGAVIVDSAGTIIAATHNLVESTCDPTAHAELLAIRSACEFLKSPRILECDLYVTLEPCAMCAQAIAHARIRRVYYGAPDAKGGGVEHGARIFSQPTCHHKPDVYGGIAEAEAALLLKNFFQNLRN